jgi:hypothetical protein
MSDKPPPDLVLFVSATQPGAPVEIAHAMYAMFDELSVSVRLADGAPTGYAADLAARLREAFPGKTIAVI